MTKYSWSKLMFFMTLIMELALAACGGGSSEEESDEGSGESGGEEGSEGGGDSASGEDLYNYEDYNTVVANDAEPTGEGTLKVGLTSDTPFEGTLNFKIGRASCREREKTCEGGV